MTAGPVVPVAQEQLRLHPVTDGRVTIGEGFWSKRQRLNRDVTIPYGMEMLEKSGTIENLRIAAGTAGGAYKRPPFRDSDLYKVLEAIAWERAHGADTEQERFFAAAVDVLEAAQDPDGYLNSYVQVVEKGRRFADPAMGHELYCAGHLIQASVADVRTSGGDTALAGVAGRFAQLLVEVLPGERRGFVPGHPEIETALVELYRTNGDSRLLGLAADLLGRRGHDALRDPAGLLSWHSFEPGYFQDDVPFEEAMTIRGHAVRALYLLAGATDIYTETGREELLRPIHAQWQDMVATKTYLTGGIGSRHRDESFGDAYELPPDRAYCETCAAIASIHWNWRLLLITGEARYAELVERTLYNGFLAGVGLDGTSFFYVNPLQAREPTARKAWYDCACCPPNIMRLLASLDHYLATTTGDGLQIHQYVASRIRVPSRSAGAMELVVETGYPFDGTVALRVTEAPPGLYEVALRVPSWAASAEVGVNGRPHPGEPGTDGYSRVRREWAAGDEILLVLPLGARAVRAAHEVDGARGCVAYERGPLVYCIESAGLPEREHLRGVDVDASQAPVDEPGLDISGETVVALRLGGRLRPEREPAGWPYHASTGAGLPGGAGGEERVQSVELRAVPYYAWGNRGATDMRVWIPEQHENG